MGLSIGRLYEYFDAAAPVEASTKTKCRSAVRRLIAWRQSVGASVEAAAIAVHEVGAWQLWLLRTGLRRTSLAGYVAGVSQVYRWAVEAELLADNPFARARKLRAPAPEVETFGADEVRDLVAAAGAVEAGDDSARLRWLAMIVLAAGSGPRIGEIHNLRWEDLDLEAAIVHVRYHPPRSGECWEWGSKTMKPRLLPLSDTAVVCYERLGEVATWRYPHLPEPTCRRLQALATSLTEEQRKRPYGSCFYSQWARIRAYADGLRRLAGRPPLRVGAFHTLRKTAITDWLKAKVRIADVQAVAGHASRTTTLTYYDAVVDREAVENVRRVLNQEVR